MCPLRSTLPDQLPADTVPQYDHCLLTLSHVPPVKCIQEAALLNKLAWHKPSAYLRSPDPRASGAVAGVAGFLSPSGPCH